MGQRVGYTYSTRARAFGVSHDLCLSGDRREALLFQRRTVELGDSRL